MYLADCQQAKTNAETAAGAAETDALDAEAWANGTRNGSPIPPTDPAYQKYSKWWAEHGANSLAGLTDVNITSPQDGDTLAYDSATQKWINVAAGPTPVTVTLTINGAKEDSITIYDSNNVQVGSCIFEANATYGICQIDVPVGGGTYKFISGVAQVKDNGSWVDYEKTVTLADSPSQTVNVYPSGSIKWYGNNIVSLGFLTPTLPSPTWQDSRNKITVTENTNSTEFDYDGYGLEVANYGTQAPIALDNYSSIKIRYHGTNSNHAIRLGLVREQSVTNGYDTASANRKLLIDEGTSVTVNDTLESMDISSLTGNYYIYLGFMCMGADPGHLIACVDFIILEQQ